VPDYPEIICHSSWATWDPDDKPLPGGTKCRFCEHELLGDYVEVLRTYWGKDSPKSHQVHFNLHPHCAKSCGFTARFNY